MTPAIREWTDNTLYMFIVVLVMYDGLGVFFFFCVEEVGDYRCYFVIIFDDNLI